MKLTFFRFFTELTSSRFISSITGTFAKSKISKFMIPTFANIYNIKIEEAEMDLDQYPTLNSFFTRRLKPGTRVIDRNDQSLASPVDARITAVGEINDAKELIVKGQRYTPLEIINDFDDLQVNNFSHFIVLYLSPTDYHRIHAPVSGTWKSHLHVPGAVYPVHDPALTHIRGVLKRNERLTTCIQSKFGEVAVCKVGAMNVSSIQYAVPIGTDLIKGGELAYFEFGSTVVLFVSGNFNWDSTLVEGGRVRMGQAIGHWS